MPTRLRLVKQAQLPTLLRITRHDFLKEQKDFLKDKIGPFNLIQYKESVNPVVLKELNVKFSPDYVEVVLPIPLLEKALEIFEDSVIIRTIMQRQVMDDDETRNTFIGYERIINVKVETAPL